MALQLGSERMTGSPGGAPSVVPHRRPAGLRHAVPPGALVALCGVAPPLVWADSIWPDARHPDDLCPQCRQLALDYRICMSDPHERPRTTREA